MLWNLDQHNVIELFLVDISIKSISTLDYSVVLKQHLCIKNTICLHFSQIVLP